MPKHAVDSATSRAPSPVAIASFTIECVDHDFLESFKPTREPQTIELGRFKGYLDARYVGRPTLASDLGRMLYEQWSGSSMAIGLASPWSTYLVVTRRDQPAAFDSDAWTAMTIRMVSAQEFEQMRLNSSESRDKE
jgi:hypothetical protein